jgi:hypothetical protein
MPPKKPQQRMPAPLHTMPVAAQTPMQFHPMPVMHEHQGQQIVYIPVLMNSHLPVSGFPHGQPQPMMGGMHGGMMNGGQRREKMPQRNTPARMPR